MKTGKYENKLRVTVKVSVGCEVPGAMGSNESQLALRGLRATLRIVGASYEDEVLERILAEMESRPYIDPPHQVDKQQAEKLALAKVVVKDIDAKVHELQANLHIVKKQLRSILNLTEDAPREVLINAVRYAAEDALRIIGDDK